MGFKIKLKFPDSGLLDSLFFSVNTEEFVYIQLYVNRDLDI